RAPLICRLPASGRIVRVVSSDRKRKGVPRHWQIGTRRRICDFRKEKPVAGGQISNLRIEAALDPFVPSIEKSRPSGTACEIVDISRRRIFEHVESLPSEFARSCKSELRHHATRYAYILRLFSCCGSKQRAGRNSLESRLAH